MGRPGKLGRSFSNCSRSGSATDFAAGDGMSGGAGNGASTATATTKRDFVTRFGTLRLRIARTRGKSFLPVGLRRFQRRAEEVSLLIREAFLRGISTR